MFTCAEALISGSLALLFLTVLHGSRTLFLIECPISVALNSYKTETLYFFLLACSNFDRIHNCWVEKCFRPSKHFGHFIFDQKQGLFFE